MQHDARRTRPFAARRAALVPGAAVLVALALVSGGAQAQGADLVLTPGPGAGGGGGNVLLIGAAPAVVAPDAVAAEAAAVITAAPPVRDDGVTIFVAQPAASGGGLSRPGLPQPSIIIGERPVVQASLPVDPEPEPEEPALPQIAWDDVEGRRALRAVDPALFATLLESGALDPPAARLAVAMQTELARMNCYLGRIDGDFGRGSRGAATAFFEQVSVTPVSVDASPGTWRQILLHESDEVSCPAPAAPAVAATPRASGGGQQAARPATTAQAPAPAPAAPERPAAGISRLGAGPLR